MLIREIRGCLNSYADFQLLWDCRRFAFFLITRIYFYMKYLFYIVVIAFIYRVIFRPKVIVEHRHFSDKKPDEKQKRPRPDAELTDYEEIK